MEFKQVVGRRRSIRFFEPWRPVERQKIQTILEAVYRAPRLLEADFVRVVVVQRDKLSADQLTQLKTPTTTAQLDMASAYLFFFADVNELERVSDGSNLRELMSRGILNPSHGWTESYLDQKIIPYLRSLLDDADRAPIAFRRPQEGAPPVPMASRRVLAAARHSIGVAQAHALLAAVNQGLGVLLSALGAARVLTVPEGWVPAGSPMFVGYPGESVEAGGQRPREPLEEDFFELRYGHPFYREPAVVERLRAELMIQEPAPVSWRFDELRGMARKYGLPE